MSGGKQLFCGWDWNLSPESLVTESKSGKLKGKKPASMHAQLVTLLGSIINLECWETARKIYVPWGCPGMGNEVSNIWQDTFWATSSNSVSKLFTSFHIEKVPHACPVINSPCISCRKAVCYLEWRTIWLTGHKTNPLWKLINSS